MGQVHAFWEGRGLDDELLRQVAGLCHNSISAPLILWVT